MPNWDMFRVGQASRRRRIAKRKGTHRSLLCESLENRNLLTVGDVRVDFEFVDSGGSPISSVNVGDAFQMRVNIQDARTNPTGLLKGYLDLTYAANLASVNGALTHGAAYNIATSGDASTPGLVDEVGGLDSDAFPPSSPGSKFLLFTLPLRAQNAGTLTFTADPAENPIRVFQYFSSSVIPFTDLVFSGNSLQIQGGAINVTPTSGLTTTESAGTSTFQIVLNQQPTADVTMGLSSSNASEGSVSTNSVTFTSANWNTPRTITVTGVEDTLVDGNKSYSIITAPATSSDVRFNGINPSDVSLTNQDNDQAALTISAPVITETNADQTVNFTVTSDKAVTGGFSVAFNTTAGTATSGSDFSVTTSSPLSFTGNAGETKNITVTIRGDQLVERNETFTVTLATVTAPSVPASSITTGAAGAATIGNDDIAILSLSSPTITESNGDQTVNFAVAVDKAVEGGFALAFSNNNGSADGTDYSVVTASPLSFTGNTGETKNIAITIKGDQVVEGNETFSIVLGTVTPNVVSASNITTGASTTATINNDDTATLTLTAPSITETNADQTVNYTVRLDRAVAGGFTVAFNKTNGTADASDNSVITSSPLTFAGTAGETQNIAVRITGDQIVEGNETFSMTLGTVTPTAPVAAASITTGASANATIVNDDVAALTIVAPNITESDVDQTVNIAVMVDKAVAGGFSVAFTSSSGTAGAGDVLINTSSPLTFTGSAGEVRNIAVTIRGDQVVEANETFSIALGAVTPVAPVLSTSITSGASTTATINNDDVATLTISAPAITESNSNQTVNVTVSVDKAVSGGFSVAFSNANGTANAPDYSVTTASPLAFTGTAGESKTIAVTIQGDQIVEGNESFTVTLGAVTAATVSTQSIVSGAVGTATINNDDAATLTLTAPTITESNADQTVQFSVRLDQAVAGGLSVAFNNTNGTAGSGDYQVSSISPLTFTGSAGETQNIAVVIKGEQTVERDETFSIALGAVTVVAPIQAASISVGTAVTGTITNDDSATLSITPLSITETDADQSVNFVVTLDNAVEDGFAVEFSNTNGTADANDYTVSTSSPLTFTGTAGETKQISTTIRGDQVVEGNETFTLTLGAVTPVSVPVPRITTGALTTSTITNDDTATLSFVVPAISETNADQTVNVVVRSDRAVAGGFTVAFNNANGTAGAGDYSVTTASPLTFTGTAGETQNIAVIIRGDQVPEGNENFGFTLGAVTVAPPVAAASITTGATTSVTVQDDDTAILAITAPTITETDSDQMAHFAVTLDKPIPGGFTVAFNVSNGTADASDFLVTTNSPLTFVGTPGETQQIEVTIRGDAIVEGNETFTVTLGTVSNTSVPVGGITTGAAATATVNNDDQAMLIITEPLITESDADQLIEFEVRLDKAVQDGLTVAFTGESETASNSDFTINTVSPLSFAGTAGETKKINVTIRGDRIVERTETFSLRLGTVTPAGAVQASDIISGDVATGVIENDDSTSLTIADVTKLEGTGSTATLFTFNVAMTNPVAGGFDLAFGVTGISASLGNDFSLGSTSPLHFSGNENETQTITVQVTADSTVEPEELLEIALGAITNLGEGIDGSRINIQRGLATGRITDDDSAVLAIANVSSAEGSGGGSTLVVFAVTLSNRVAGGLDLAFNVSAVSATLGSDFSVATGGPLHFAGVDDEVSTIVIQVTADETVELDETLQVFLGAISNLASGIDPSRITVNGSPATGTITNDDTATISIDDVIHPEGDTGQTSFDFTVTLSNPVDVPVSIDFATVDGTARLSDNDYQNATGTLVFNPGESRTRNITVVANGDIRVESDEAFAVELRNLQAGTPAHSVTVARNQGIGTIDADDGTLIEITDVQITEGNAGTKQLVFNVTASKPVSQTVTVDFTTEDVDARAADGDYQPQQGQVTFSPGGALTQNIAVTVNGDQTVELDESFRIVLSNVASSIPEVILNRPVGLGTISNDDTSRLSIANVTVLEGDTGTKTFNFAVTLSRPADVDVSIDYRTVDGTARVADADYQSATGTLAFRPGESLTQNITVVVNSDTIVEPDEAFEVLLENLSAGTPARAVTLEQATATGTIRSDDTATLAIAATQQPAEGASNGAFTITTNRRLQEAAVLTLNINGSASAGADYTALATTVTFPANVDSITLPLALLPDQLVEGVEAVVVTLTGVNSQLVSIGTSDSATMNIADNDTASLSIEATKNFTEQGGAQTVTVTLTTSDGAGGTATLAPGITLQADVNTVVGTASAADFTSVAKQSISFTPGSENGTTATVTLTAINDTLVEGNETAQLQLQLVGSTLGSQVTVGNANTAVTVQDNETASLSIESTKTVNEQGGSQTVVVTLSTSDGSGGTATLAPGVTLQADVVDAGGGTATSGVDYPAIGTRTITFPSGAGNGATTTMTLTPTNDTLIEGRETVQLRLQNLLAPSGGQFTLNNTNSTVTIQDNDSATLSIEASKTMPEEGGAQQVVVTLTTSDGAGGAATLAPGITLQAQVIDAGGRTATSGADYAALAAATVNFAAGSGNGTTSNVTLNLTNESLVEGQETIALQLQNLQNSLDGQVSLGNANSTVTIQDNDRATLSIEATKTVTEQGGARTIVVTLTTSNGAGGTATLGPGISLQADVTSLGIPESIDIASFGTQTVNFAAGSGNGTTATVTLTPINDTLVEGNEDVALQLQNLRPTVNGQAVLGNVTSTVTIQDNDSAQLSIEPSKTFTEQGGAQSIVITLTTSDGAGGTATLASVLEASVVDVGTGTATVLVDYGMIGTPALGRQPISFAAGAGNGAAASVTFNPVNDTLVEGAETVNLRLDLPQVRPANVSLGNANTAITIQDNDTASLAIEASKDVTEAGGSQSVVITLSTSDGAGGSATLAPGVTLQVDVVEAGGGTATSGTDYTAFGTQTASFAAGATNGATATVPLAVTNDSLVEGNETVLLRLQNVRPTSGLATLGNSNSTVTIQDNDTATLSIEATKVVLEQGGAQTVTVTLTTSNGAGGTATLAPGITLRADIVDAGGGSAVSGADYEAFGTQQVTLTAGDGNNTTKTVNVTPIRDSQLDPDRTVNLRLQSLSQTLNGAASLGTVNSVVTIRDNPASAELRGFVYVDINGNGQRETTESGIPGITITLDGTDVTGRTIHLVAMTADDGAYGFTALPSGSYSITETSPSTYLDSIDTIGSQGGTTANDQFSNIQLDFDEIGQNNNFGERGLTPQWVTIRMFLGSTLVNSNSLRTLEAQGVQSNGNSDQASAVRNRSIPSVVALPAQTAGEGESRPVAQIQPTTAPSTTSQPTNSTSSPSTTSPSTSSQSQGEGESRQAASVVVPRSTVQVAKAEGEAPVRQSLRPSRLSIAAAPSLGVRKSASVRSSHPPLSTKPQENGNSDTPVRSERHQLQAPGVSETGASQPLYPSQPETDSWGNDLGDLLPSRTAPRDELLIAAGTGNVEENRPPCELPNCSETAVDATAIIFGQDDSLFDPLAELYDTFE